MAPISHAMWVLRLRKTVNASFHSCSAGQRRVMYRQYCKYKYKQSQLSHHANVGMVLLPEYSCPTDMSGTEVVAVSGVRWK